MEMQIQKGKIIRPQKVVLYGVEGVGKTTLAAQFPHPVFIDTEGGSGHLDVARFPVPTSWESLKKMVVAACELPLGEPMGTLVLDTADWAERLCAEHICAKANRDGIEDFGYGKGYTYLEEEFARLLDLLSELPKRGVNVVVTAHAAIRKFEQPDEMGAYDRWELKLEKKTAPLLKEWADALLFLNYETFTVTDDKGKKKAAGGKRVMYTQHHPCWDAKNRWGLPEKCPLEYARIAPYIAAMQITGNPHERTATPKQQTLMPEEEPDQASDMEPIRDYDLPAEWGAQPPDGIPLKLWDLMQFDKIGLDEVQAAVTARGYYPVGTPIQNYDPAFVDGVLVAAWDQIKTIIIRHREEK